MKPFRWLLTAAAIIAASAINMKSETFALKTNVVGWATTTMNVGGEIATGRRTTFQVFGALNPWNFNGGDKTTEKHAKYWCVEPEFRYWFCEKFNGWFIGVHALGGEYNVKNVKLPLGMLPDAGKEGRHFEGWYAGAGIGCGYQWMLSRNWNFEASLGVGYAYSPYKLYGNCDRVLEDKAKHYFGPTKLALSIMYIF